ncbi:hypothetical protein Btru_023195 [Bulinus truncatus]|nr:hypothetical protein Btru_023195 [Bulinus truncatus]
MNCNGHGQPKTKIGGNFTVIEVAPQGGQPPAPRSVHSSGSYVRKAIEDLPDAMDRIWNLRDNLHDDYIKKRRPYAGELGISSYLPRQIPSYNLVRGIVEEFVNKFVATHIPADHKVTSAMTKEVANEGIHQDLMYKKMSANLFIREAESQATGNAEGRDPNDPAYDLVTNTFYTLQKNRDHFKKHIWSHSQLLRHNGTPPPQVIHIVPPPPPKTKKKSKITKTPPQAPVSVPKMAVVEDQPLDADVKLITYDHLHPVDLKSLERLPTDEAVL